MDVTYEAPKFVVTCYAEAENICKDQNLKIYNTYKFLI